MEQPDCDLLRPLCSSTCPGWTRGERRLEYDVETHVKVTLLPDQGPGSTVLTDVEGQDDDPREAPAHAGGASDAFARRTGGSAEGLSILRAVGLEIMEATLHARRFAKPCAWIAFSIWLAAQTIVFSRWLKTSPYDCTSLRCQRGSGRSAAP